MKVEIKREDGRFNLYRNENLYFIKGIGGGTNIELASRYGANSIRTWGANHAEKVLNTASQYDMTVMLGISMSKKNEHYLSDEYKNEKRAEVETVVNQFKNHESLLIWTLGNEFNLGTNSKEAWEFVNELADLIKSLDSNHPVCTVLAGAEADVLNQVAKYSPSIDVIGVNSYARGLPHVRRNLENSQFNGPCVITEWGPTGHWEVQKTTWNAPIEQTSTEKKESYNRGYDYIETNNDLILGSYVFLWGQKEERTPTWYGMFVEHNEELGLQGELCPTVDVMKLRWTGSLPENQAPLIHQLTLNELLAKESIVITQGQLSTVTVDVTDPDGDQLSFTWEILHEATKLGFGGSYEPRPERVGEVIKTTEATLQFQAPEVGKYRVYVYVLDGYGHVATANIPFMVE